MAHKVILPPKKNYIPQFLKQRDINSYSLRFNSVVDKTNKQSMVCFFSLNFLYLLYAVDGLKIAICFVWLGNSRPSPIQYTGTKCSSGPHLLRVPHPLDPLVDGPLGCVRPPASWGSGNASPSSSPCQPNTGASLQKYEHCNLLLYTFVYFIVDVFLK